jgi:hypothetical protein
MAAVKHFPPIGMSPGVWGPVFWTTMHIVSLGYPRTPTEDEKAAASNFYNSLAYMIPCPICKEHYRHFLETDPVDDALNSRDELITWVFNLHNKVNEKLSKKQVTWEEFIQQMSVLSNKQSLSIVHGGSHGGNGLWPVALIAGVATGIAAYAVYQKMK